MCAHQRRRRSLRRTSQVSPPFCPNPHPPQTAFRDSSPTRIAPHRSPRQLAGNLLEGSRDGPAASNQKNQPHRHRALCLRVCACAFVYPHLSERALRSLRAAASGVSAQRCIKPRGSCSSRTAGAPTTRPKCTRICSESWTPTRMGKWT